MGNPAERKKERVKFRIIDFSCVTCANIIKKKLDNVAGVEDVKTNPVLNEIYVYFDPELVVPDKIEDVVRRTGYKAIRVRGE